MNRIVFWLALIAFGYLIWRFVQLAQRKNQRWRDQRRTDAAAGGGSAASGTDGAEGSTARNDDGAAAQLPRSEVMVRCARCGVYLPSSEALTRRDEVFCSAEHRDAGNR